MIYNQIQNHVSYKQQSIFALKWKGMKQDLTKTTYKYKRNTNESHINGVLQYMTQNKLVTKFKISLL